MLSSTRSHVVFSVHTCTYLMFVEHTHSYRNTYVFFRVAHQMEMSSRQFNFNSQFSRYRFLKSYIALIRKTSETELLLRCTRHNSRLTVLDTYQSKFHLRLKPNVVMMIQIYLLDTPQAHMHTTMPSTSYNPVRLLLSTLYLHLHHTAHAQTN